MRTASRSPMLGSDHVARRAVTQGRSGMDTARFDTLIRSLHDARSRRSTLAIVLGGALGLLGLAQPNDAAAKSGTCKPKCGECKTCKKGNCTKKDGKTVCKKGKCQATALGTTCS